MNKADIFFGIFCILLGASFSFYRIKIYPSRVREHKGIFIPGIPPGSLEDKIFYIGSALAVFIIGIYFVAGEIFK